MKKCLYHVLYANTISAFTTSKKEKYEKLPEMDNIAEPILKSSEQSEEFQRNFYEKCIL